MRLSLRSERPHEDGRLLRRYRKRWTVERSIARYSEPSDTRGGDSEARSDLPGDLDELFQGQGGHGLEVGCPTRSGFGQGAGRLLLRREFQNRNVVVASERRVGGVDLALHLFDPFPEIVVAFP